KVLIPLIFAVSTVSASAVGSSGEAATLQPEFNETPCDLSGVSPEIRPRLRCDTVSVPRNYDTPGSGQFQLSLLVDKSPQEPPLPDPVVYISGGPGAPLTVYAQRQARTPYSPRRDLILVDQRGTGRSEPSLCPELNHALLDANFVVADAVGTLGLEDA